MLFKYPITTSLLCLLLASCASGPTSTTVGETVREAFQGESRIALVIGNANYPSLDKKYQLNNPLQDAKAMIKALEDLHFKVISHENLTKAKMETAFQQFREELKISYRPGTKRVALFYYSGHGAEYNGDNWLLAVDAANPPSDKKADKNLPGVVPLASLFTEINGLNETLKKDQQIPTQNIFILDNCRNNPTLARNEAGEGVVTRSVGEALKGVAWADDKLTLSDEPSNSFFAYATARGKVARDGEGTNSPYTQELVARIADPGVPIDQLFQEVIDEVKKKTGQAQQPWKYSGLGGDFYFARSSSPIGGFW